MTDDGLMWLCGAEPGANATQQEKDAYVREVADCTERWERREKGGAEKAAEPAQAAPEAEPQPGGPQEAQDGAEDAAGPGENT